MFRSVLDSVTAPIAYKALAGLDGGVARAELWIGGAIITRKMSGAITIDSPDGYEAYNNLEEFANHYTFLL